MSTEMRELIYRSERRHAMGDAAQPPLNGKHRMSALGIGLLLR